MSIEEIFAAEIKEGSLMLIKRCENGNFSYESLILDQVTKSFRYASLSESDFYHSLELNFEGKNNQVFKKAKSGEKAPSQ